MIRLHLGIFPHTTWCYSTDATQKLVFRKEYMINTEEPQHLYTILPAVRKTRFGLHSFRNLAPDARNKLKDTKRKADTLSIFKYKLR